MNLFLLRASCVDHVFSGGNDEIRNFSGLGISYPTAKYSSVMQLQMHKADTGVLNAPCPAYMNNQCENRALPYSHHRSVLHQ